uniref:Uncharacterized protein n=1 Tax=Anguilla anguilla TaxID=7936 RepID=A0A0E9T274_ANGAN
MLEVNLLAPCFYEKNIFSDDLKSPYLGAVLLFEI